MWGKLRMQTPKSFIMRDSISLIICFLLVWCFSTNLHAQSAEEKLDQVELMKQLIGIWEMPIGENSSYIIEFVPVGEAMYLKEEIKENGELTLSSVGVWGVSPDKNTITSAAVGDDGYISFEYGKFVSANKFLSERFRDDQKHPTWIHEFEILSPESFTIRAKRRGEQMTWDAEWGERVTFNKIQ